VEERKGAIVENTIANGNEWGAVDVTWNSTATNRPVSQKEWVAKREGDTTIRTQVRKKTRSGDGYLVEDVLRMARVAGVRVPLPQKQGTGERPVVDPDDHGIIPPTTVGATPGVEVEV